MLGSLITVARRKITSSVFLVRSERLVRSEEHTSELQSLTNLVCRLLLEKKKKKNKNYINTKTTTQITQKNDTTRKIKYRNENNTTSSERSNISRDAQSRLRTRDTIHAVI